MKKVVLLLVFVVLFVGVIGTVSAGAKTEKFTVPLHLEFYDDAHHCSGVPPVWVVIDGVQKWKITTNKNSTHFNIRTNVEVKLLDPDDHTTLLGTDQVRSNYNENINKHNKTIHNNHIFNGQFADGSKWHGVLVEQTTWNANGDVVVDFSRENFINCP